MLDALFHALSDPTRRDILRRTMLQEHSVTQLAVEYPMSFAAVQKHVAQLERAGLVIKHRRGREHLVRAEVGSIRVARQVLDDLEDLWLGRVSRIEQILAEDPASPTLPPQGGDR